MSAASTAAKPLPVVPYLMIPDDGEPYLEGTKCAACGAVYLGERMACGKCGKRETLAKVPLANSGRLYSYCIVHRSFPGIDVPYISAIVDLDGGGTVKGNLIAVDPDPEKIAFDMPVRLVFRDALGRKDRDGNSYLSYFFEPQ